MLVSRPGGTSVTWAGRFAFQGIDPNEPPDDYQPAGPGHRHRFSVPSDWNLDGPSSVVVGPDGALWVSGVEAYWRFDRAEPASNSPQYV